MRIAQYSVLLSIVVYIILSFVKVYGSNVTSSTALLADGFNNMTDIIAALALFIGLKVAQLSPRARFPYGFLRAETLASLIASIIMLIVGLQVVRQAFITLQSGTSAVPSLFAAYVSLFCMIIMIALYLFNMRQAKKLRSVAIYTAALDNRSDALISFGVAVGIICAVNGLTLLDVLTALFIGAAIVKTAITLFLHALMTLMDAFHPAIVKHLEQTIREVDGVEYVRHIQGRTLGSTHFVNVDIAVHPRLTISQGEKIAAEVARKVGEHYVLFISVKSALKKEMR